MDDDTTTMARVRQNIDHDIDKWRCISRVKNNLGKKLYSLPQTHKNAICTDDIKHLMKCFTNAIHGNKNDAEQIKSAILAITPYVFNEYGN